MKPEFKEGDEVIDSAGYVFVVDRITKNGGVFLTSLDGVLHILTHLPTARNEYAKREEDKKKV